MPQMDGIETIKMLIREFPEVRIIAISGGGTGRSGGDLEEAKKVGADYAFMKPLELEQIFSAIEELIS